MRPGGIEPATFRFVVQYLNHCATAVPLAPYLCEIDMSNRKYSGL